MPPSSSSFSTSPTKRNGVVRSDTNTLLSFIKTRIKKCDCHVAQSTVTPAETPRAGSGRWRSAEAEVPAGLQPHPHADTPRSASHDNLTFPLFRHGGNNFTLQVLAPSPGSERTRVHHVAARPAEERDRAPRPGCSPRSPGRSPGAASGKHQDLLLDRKVVSAAKSLFRVDGRV